MADRTDILDLERFFPYRVSLLASRVSKRLSAVYRDRFGLAPAEWRVVAHLAAESRVSVRDIHEVANLDKAKISRAVARLEALGIVRKSENRRDRRLVELTLTAKGRRMYAEIVPLARAFEDELLASLSLGDRSALDRALASLARQLR
jgi:DNA-binding MarR family transcriptional regulator